jgi:hypothetical protein
VSFEKYDDCVDWTKKYLGSQEQWIFEDLDGKFHSISLVNGQDTFNHYALTERWIPRGRVFTQTKVVTMWTGVEL